MSFLRKQVSLIPFSMTSEIQSKVQFVRAAPLSKFLNLLHSDKVPPGALPNSDSVSHTHAGAGVI